MNEIASKKDAVASSQAVIDKDRITRRDGRYTKLDEMDSISVLLQYKIALCKFELSLRLMDGDSGGAAQAQNAPAASTRTAMAAPPRAPASSGPVSQPSSECRISSRTTLDRDFDPDMKAYYASGLQNTPELHVAVPGKPDMRMRLNRVPCSASPELAGCANGARNAFWVSVEMDGKLKTYACPERGGPEQCLYTWRTEGKPLIDRAKGLDQAAVDTVGGVPGALADGSSARRGPPAPPASGCVTVNPEPRLYGGFVNTCDYEVNVSYCAYQPTKGAWNEIFNCERAGAGGLSGIAPHGAVAAHTNGTRMHWFACAAPAMPTDVYFNGRLYGRCS